MPKTKTRKNTSVKRLLKRIREINQSRKYGAFKMRTAHRSIFRPRHSQRTKSQHRRMRGGNSSSSIQPLNPEVVVPFVNDGNIQNTYSKLVSGTLQADAYGKV